jgi:glycosyltransferase involved in cell wall biosynthesis
MHDNGGSIHTITPYTRNPFENATSFFKLMKKESYDIVHFHLNSLLNVAPLVECGKRSTKIIIHSHSTRANGGKAGQLIHSINRALLRYIKCTRIACSEEAGIWMFGKRPFTIVNNGINVNEYKFNIAKRESTRKRLGIRNDCMLIGHVGRFTYAKNHEFILQVYERLKRSRKNSTLLLVGDGELSGSIKKQVAEMSLSPSVIMTGNVDSVPDYLYAMDAMLFPSHFEGLPFALIEAQATGLPVLASSSVSQTARITDLVEYEDLNSSIGQWVEQLVRLAERGSGLTRRQYADIVDATDFSDKKMAQKMLNLYRNV